MNIPKIKKSIPKSEKPKKPVKFSTAAPLKKAGVDGGFQPIRKGAWQHAKEQAQASPGTPKTINSSKRTLALTDGAMMAMAQDKVGGMTHAQLAQKYNCSATYVEDALRTLFVSSAKGRELLKGVLLDNAIATGMKARKHVDDLTPMQAVVSAGIMTQRFIDLDKHTQNLQEDVDVSELKKVGRLIDELDGIVSQTGEVVGDIVDLSGDLETE